MDNMNSVRSRRTRQDAVRWSALVRKNNRREAFFYGVKTTGVFCRSNCTSRLPRRENVRFFDSPREALTAGFRACKRCQPTALSCQEERDGKITRACRLLEREGAQPPISLRALARLLGFSPFHFQRLFKASLGVSPKQFQSMHRMNCFRKEIRRQKAITTAVYEAGFGSASRAYDGISQRLGMTPRQFKKGGSDSTILFSVTRISLGWLLVAMSTKGICAIEIGSSPAALRRSLQATFPRAAVMEDQAALADYLRNVVDHIDAPGSGIGLPLDIRGTAFQRRVWQALQQIPLGKTLSYQAIAQRLNSPNAARAVASACAANKLAVVIPCHRVVRSDGHLGGFRWGLETKRDLLERERTRRNCFPPGKRNGQ
jgi:AraC family transcriptional regulator of adaptative response/methylated-DNA-[protein]-cysteine methyltransferase